MVSRYYRDRLQAVLATADDESISEVSNNWVKRAGSVEELAKSLRKQGRTIESEIEGQAGRAMVAKFNEISDKLELAAADLKKGSGALGAAHTAALTAIQARNGIMLSGPMNQEPVKPEGPLPGQQPDAKQTAAMGTYNAQMATYLENEQRYEDNARKALEAMDTEYQAQAQVMKEIHGEPDPTDSPSSPGSSTPPGSVPPPGTPTSPVGPPPGNDQQPTVKPPPRNVEPTPIKEPLPVIQPPTEVVHPPITQPPTTTHPPTVHPPYTPTEVPEYQPGHYSTNVSGGTDSGVDYTPSTFPGHGPSVGSGGAGGGGMSGPGMAAGGLAAGGAAGAAATPLRTSGVKGIGATTRASGPGSLSRGSTPGSAGARSASASRGASVGGTRGAAGAKGATGGSRTAAGAGSRSASTSAKAGAKGATSRGAAGRGSASTAGKGSTKGTGKGLFRRGGNGSAAGSRGGRTKDEPRTEQRDALVYEQDWLGDESAGPGVLD